MAKNKKEMKNLDRQIVREPEQLSQNNGEKLETPEKETKEIAYSIAMREMADDTSSLKKLNRSEEQKKERCGRT